MREVQHTKGCPARSRDAGHGTLCWCEHTARQVLHSAIAEFASGVSPLSELNKAISQFGKACARDTFRFIAEFAGIEGDPDTFGTDAYFFLDKPHRFIRDLMNERRERAGK